MTEILKGVFWAIVIVGLAVAYRACAQDTTGHILPDAPSSSKGMHCFASTIDEQGKISQKEIFCESIPAWKDFKVVEQRPKPKFFTYRKDTKAPALYTNKQLLQSKLFMASQVGGLAAMIVACKRRNSGEDFGSEAPASVGIGLLSIVGAKYFTMSYGVGPGVYEMVHYSIAAAK